MSFGVVNVIKLFLVGVVAAATMVVPGVSGSMMLMLLGYYDTILKTINQFIDALIAFDVQKILVQCGILIPFGIGVVITLTTPKLTSAAAPFVSPKSAIVIKLFLVGVVAAATMVVPGVSGSMMLMLLGYYDTILKTINQFIDALIAFDVQKILVQCGILIPFGIGVVIGIFLIAKLIEFIFMKAEIHAYYAIIGLILASPIAILFKVDWSGLSVLTIVVGIVTFCLGWFTASKLGGE